MDYIVVRKIGTIRYDIMDYIVVREIGRRRYYGLHCST